MVKSKKRETIKANTEKWSERVWALGWAGVPDVLLKYQDWLGLGPLDMNLIVQLINHWWEADAPPFPSKKTLAERVGRSESAVQRSISKMERAGYIKREDRFTASGGRSSNSYDLGGLVKAVQIVAAYEEDQRSGKAVKDRAVIIKEIREELVRL